MVRSGAGVAGQRWLPAVAGALLEGRAAKPRAPQGRTPTPRPLALLACVDALRVAQHAAQAVAVEQLVSVAQQQRVGVQIDDW